MARSGKKKSDKTETNSSVVYNVWVLRSVAEPELHHLVGAVTRCGSDDGNQHGLELKNDTKCNSL
jgi:hypothetical protein